MAKFLVGLLLVTVSFATYLRAWAASSSSLPQVKARLGKVEIWLEVADNNETRTQGLMYRTQMAENAGMLFVFDHEQPLTFWMKNTLLPLSIGFFDNTLKLINVLEMAPEPVTVLDFTQYIRYSSAKPARFALEMNKNWYRKHKIPDRAQLIFISQDLPKSLQRK